MKIKANENKNMSLKIAIVRKIRKLKAPRPSGASAGLWSFLSCRVLVVIVTSLEGKLHRKYPRKRRGKSFLVEKGF